MFKRKSAAACGVVLAFALAAAVHAWDSSPRATLTFSKPVSLPDVTLAAGTYVFELADPDSSRSIVRVRGKEDYRHVYFSAFTYRIARPAGLSVDRPVLLGESAAGAAPPILAWCPRGGATGHEFIHRR
jgi:hypothetical protein